MKIAERRPAAGSFISQVKLEGLSTTMHRSWQFDLPVRCPCGEGTKPRCKEHTDISDVDGQMEEVQNVVNNTARGHYSWIDGASHNASKWIPCCVVEPVPEFLRRSE